jgi:hypothetical protein
MWLYLPSSQLNSAPVSACLEKVSAPHSSILESNTEPFSTWNGKPLLLVNLSRLWKRERSIQRLSGLTCLRSTVQLGADAWISSLRDSRAKTSVLPVAAPDSTASVPASSSTCSTLPTIAVRGASFWRTSQASLLPPPPLWTKPKAILKSARPPASWENWPTAGGMRSGSLFQRPTWVPAMAVHAGSASLGEWLTPNVPNGGRSVSAEMVASHGMTVSGEKRTVGLESQTKHWATPTAQEHTGAGHPETKQGAINLRSQVSNWATPDCNTSTYSNGKFGPNLRQQSADWPTPRATDGTKGGPNQAGSKGDLMLPSAAAQWPTPASRDYRTPNSQEIQESRQHTGGEQLPNYVEHHFLHPVLSIHDGRELSPTAQTLPRRLNPAFGCWLMGWPIWWTNPALTNSVKLEMELYRSALQLQLSSCFDVQGLPERLAA